LITCTQAGDVAARAGVKVAEAEEALQALAFDTQGALEVCTWLQSLNFVGPERITSRCLS